MILVTGATGNVGGEVVRALLARNQAARALVRDPSLSRLPSAVEVVAGDLEIPDSLDGALSGADKVFLLAGFDTLPATLELMRRADIEHVVMLTSRCVIGGRPDNAVTRRWLDSEAALRAAGMPWTILRPSGFQSNALRWRQQLEDGDVVRAPWPDVPIAAIHPADIAAVASTALSEPGHEMTTPTLSGPEPLTPADQVATLAGILDRPLRYEPLSDAEARTEMAGTAPPEIIDALFRFFSEGEFDDAGVVDTVAVITGHPARSFSMWAESNRHRFGTTTVGKSRSQSAVVTATLHSEVAPGELGD